MQVLRVDAGTIDGDECGHEWPVFYVLTEAQDDDGRPCFELWKEDDRGNGDFVCRGFHKGEMQEMTLRLGSFVEWAPGVGRKA